MIKITVGPCEGDPISSLSCINYECRTKIGALPPLIHRVVYCLFVIISRYVSNCNIVEPVCKRQG
jgi:hypothetical protein